MGNLALGKRLGCGPQGNENNIYSNKTNPDVWIHQDYKYSN